MKPQQEPESPFKGSWLSPGGISWDLSLWFLQAPQAPCVFSPPRCWIWEGTAWSHLVSLLPSVGKSNKVYKEDCALSGLNPPARQEQCSGSWKSKRTTWRIACLHNGNNQSTPPVKEDANIVCGVGILPEPPSEVKGVQSRVSNQQTWHLLIT